jgi:hypothetical protein
MKRLAALLLVPLALAALPSRAALAANSTQIQAEAARTIEGGAGRIAQFWWLPVEYWEACARDLGLSAAEQAKIAPLFRDYVMVATVDARFSEDLKKAEFKPTADIVARTRFLRGGQPVEVLKEVGPELPEVAYRLVYLMRSSLGPLAEGLRLLPLPNVDPKGNAILTGTSRGDLEIEFRFEEGGPVHERYWHAPFTSIAGEKACPKGGEALEASFEFCPWHGVKAKSP